MNTIKLEILGGTSIDSAVMQALQKSYDNKCFVTFIFNGIEMEVDTQIAPNVGFVHHYVQMYKDKIKEKNEKWLNSTEGQNYIAQQESNKKKCQKNIDKAMFELSNINWKDTKDILRWCNIIFENWIVGTEVPREEILFAFAKRNEGEHVPNQYTGNAYREDKKGEWIIGQFLAGVKNGAIPEVFASFYEKFINEN